MSDSSWVEGAEGSGFGLANLPYGAVRQVDGSADAWLAVRVGDQAVDLAGLQRDGLLDAALPLGGPVLNPLLAAGRGAWSQLRGALTELLQEGAPAEDRVRPHLHPLSECDVLLPIAIGDYVDFYSSLEHATNLGRMFRPDSDPLLPNWRELPVGYHGRASTVVPSGTPVRRPNGQRPPAADGERPTFGPSQRLDIELEMGFVTGGPGNVLGEPIPIEEAREHIFGLVLVNDWSARDIQRWEYVPLGPFLGKSFATSMSPWIVTLDALEPYRVAGPSQEPAPLEYLRCERDWAFDVGLEVELNGTAIARTNARGLYWNVAQQLTHAAVNGTAIRPGDLYASGTISGTEADQRGSLIELTWGGRDPIELPGGETRTFLQDGDTVVLRGECRREGAPAISFGEVSGEIVAA